MAVEFPSDLILDVARAADPVRARKTVAALSGGVDAPASAGSAARTPGAQFTRAAQTKDVGSVAKQFEAFLVTNMVSTMMPGDDDEGYFGGGFAGGVWKSMMAEQIANQAVKTTDFGVASKISQYFTTDGKTVEPMSGVNDAQATVEQTRSLDAARAGTEEISRDFIHKMLSLVRPGERS